jgi:2-hydroxychromene-2-carboxylate isomerase
MALSVDWYFDFVSPFSYICLHRLPEIDVPMNFKPVLFAGLLNHWGQKGPAEIPAKRRWTYRWCTWWANELGITEEGAAQGVFGVPTFVAEGEVFWGADAVDFLKAFLKDSAVLRNDEMRRLDSLPIAAARRG